jgi:hypothetical protein
LSADVAAKPGEPAGSFPAGALRDKLHKALSLYYRRRQSVERRSPWGVMHWVVAYGCDSMVDAGPERPNVTAVGWLLWNGRLAGQAILYVDGLGRVAAHRGGGLQGHAGQLLAYISQARVPLDYPLRAEGKSFTLADLVEHEKRTCEPRSELTFKLIGLAHYLSPDAAWTSDDGQNWSLERLVREELAQDVRGGACGGTHRMMGLSTAVRRRRERGLPMTGDFARADKFVADYHQYALSLQNADGSFSTEWFNRRSNAGGIQRRLETTGHVFEWLAHSLPQDALTAPSMTKAADYLADLLLRHADEDWPIGPLGHALGGLRTYESRTIAAWKPPAA